MLTKNNSFIMYVVKTPSKRSTTLQHLPNPQKICQNKKKRIHLQATEGQKQLLATNFSIAYTVRLGWCINKFFPRRWSGKVTPLQVLD